ncbi:MAG: 4'-phosphopantetheinyl transferase superfamily protein [Lachnospiraceae bacterium]|nr:4'-phosphopantetheinyl transferase superfamily protein [Lachnospiraceae bacterium]
MNTGLYITKINKPASKDHKYDSYIAHKLLNQLTNIDDREIIKNEYGKPYYNNSSIFFNLSHSNNFACCYLDIQEVGVDIQYFKETNKFINISKRFFKEEEYNYIIDSNDSLLAFYRIWSAKESYIKLKGLGLSISLNSFLVELPNNIGDIFRIDDVYLKEFLINNEYICTISAYSSHFPCEIKEFEVV